MSIYSVTSRKQVTVPVKPASSTPASSLNFDIDIKPIFQKHCNPCHFPGGKLYDRLPFDRASTIIKNEKGILRRIKDTAEVKMIRQFVEENYAENSSVSN